MPSSKKQELTKRGAVPPSVRTVRTKDGNTIEVDVTQLPQPQRVMACNVVDANLNGSSVEMTFGHRHPGSRKLAAALIVSIQSKAIPLALHGESAPTFVADLLRFVANEGIQLRDERIEASAYPERTVIERATTMAIAYVDQDAEIRFYRVLPSEFRKMQKASEFTENFLQPVVEVALPTEQLADLVTRLNQLVQRPNEEASPT